jgi:hypothetical protein
MSLIMLASIVLPRGLYVVEYRFGSFRSQAESAYNDVCREFAKSGVTIEFLPDPCGPSPTA